MEQFLTPDEVADALKVKRSTIITWLQKGKLTGIKLGDGRRAEWRIAEKDFQEFIEANTNKGDG